MERAPLTTGTTDTTDGLFSSPLASRILTPSTAHRTTTQSFISADGYRDTTKNSTVVSKYAELQ
ncbi:hypothetical protein RvY_16721 [Ramazzottius varieornatus]|uniref:Uncharacterized protein n=1 Tax=Ramazzottius varieornatus TaxID=947166 RepID=A0A1D1W239_RAMVA|nr:hypothetical protein RvY_16721 [Ramazzottius varieornatus]